MADTDRATFTTGATCIRMTEMLAHMLAELRGLEIDEHTRRQLVDIHARTLAEVDAVVPHDLEIELGRLTPALSEAATPGELRISQAQLLGWLEGVLGGMAFSVRSEPVDGQPDDG